MTRRALAGVALLCAVALWPEPLPKGPAGAAAGIPVLHLGRVKPLDTAARSSLLVLSGRQTLRFNGRKLSASQWALDALFKPEAADLYPVFLVDNPDVRGLLGLPPRSSRRLPFTAIEPKIDEIWAQADAAENAPAERRTRFQTAIEALRERAFLHHGLKNTIRPDGAVRFEDEVAEYERKLPRLGKLMASHSSGGAAGRKAFAELGAYVERYRGIDGAAQFRVAPGPTTDEWRSVGGALLGALSGGKLPQAARDWVDLSASYRRGDEAAASAAARRLAAGADAATRGELWFNRSQPFVRGMALYLIAGLLLMASWAWPRARAAGEGALLAALVVHTAGLLLRVVLQGRPPVTNLYSSAVFVAWTAALVGWLVERRRRDATAGAAGAATGFAGLIVAHHLGGSGDTMEMMRAVLDSNFWLTTHVITITIGYGAAFLASALAHLWVARRLLRGASEKDDRAVAGLVYGAVCLTLFFSFVGTVLGGIWADQSWGRFWGWDPKENGALLIVLWCAVILHARWAGFIRERGLMLSAVFGGVITSLAWFGVNMLGVGLHSYGFMDKAAWALAAFVASQLGVMVLGARTAKEATR